MGEYQKRYRKGNDSTAPLYVCVFDDGVLIQVLGGVSEDLYRGEIFYSPIIKEMYYEVVVSDIAVGGNSLELDCKEVS